MMQDVPRSPFKTAQSQARSCQKNDRICEFSLASVLNELTLKKQSYQHDPRTERIRRSTSTSATGEILQIDLGYYKHSVRMPPPQGGGVSFGLTVSYINPC